MTTLKKIILTTIISLLIIMIGMQISYATQMGKAKKEAKLRKETSNTSIVLEIIPKNDEFEILEKDGQWYRVNYKKIKGYVLSEFVEEIQENDSEKVSNGNNVVQENKQETEEEVDSQKLELGDIAVIKNTSLIYLRPVINAKTIKQVEQGKQVDIIEILNNWAFITIDGLNAWIPLKDLNKKEENIVDVEKKADEVKKEEKYLNKTAYITSDGINFREEANTSSKILKTFLQNAKITILEEQGDWYKIKYNDQEGYILKMYVSDKKAEVTSRSSEIRKTQETQETKNNQEEAPKVVNTSSKGQEIVSYAKKYLGSKYVYGGATPRGFDCSGFTMYVYKQYGVKLSHSATAQSKVGTKIEKANLQAGDLVFFSDYRTYKGIGHCGIYVGDGKFIHASTEKTGVITSSLNSGSYVKRYVTATRVV